MFKGAHDVFALIVKIWEVNWEHQHIIQFFEISKIVSQRFAKNLEEFLKKFGLIVKIISYVKNEKNKFCDWSFSIIFRFIQSLLLQVV